MILPPLRPPGLEQIGPLRLASASPRRLELLRQLGLEPEVFPLDLDETRRPGETPYDYCVRMAQTKAEKGFAPGIMACLGADTVVTKDGRVFGKPEHAARARQTLNELAGGSHQVLTAVTVAAGARPHLRTRVSTTDVWMKKATTRELDAYIATGEPMDKAGAYGIQGLGAFLIERIHGSYTGVVGLPLFETVALLQWAKNLYLEGSNIAA
ncbi:MAG: septum formation inhibitor Maf [Magnetococcales bacterium]|nr:septum formation inhibitor Maf [Magnetococcales bacterium]MBF0151092.1 septum formation inhibitor Maf [Magnetococcales bacterium]MBF0174505.1 septum formation inhibitor Maf [Magnetococcales bacterium]MBF0348460.1 septum formation inhibitor Maf [Magnetococcales bacterium]MBF0632520.1 septum formation inhibitor Maf [Magnetococcales bacterium]